MTRTLARPPAAKPRTPARPRRKPAPAPRKPAARKAPARKPAARKPAPARKPVARRRAPARPRPARPARPTRAPVDARILARRRAVRHEAVRRRRRLAATLVTLTVLGGLAFLATSSPLFDVSSVRVLGVNGEQEDAVRSAAGVIEGDNILRLDAGRIETRIAGLPWVREVSLRRVPPATVEIAVDVREPFALVRLAETLWTVDADGIVLAGGAASDQLVTIAAPDAVLPRVGEEILDTAVRNAIAVHRGLPGPLRASVLRYELEPASGLRLLLDVPDLTPETEEGLWVRFGLAERIDGKARVLGLLLDQARAQAARGEGLLIAELDVRAPDNPVIIPAR